MKPRLVGMAGILLMVAILVAPGVSRAATIDQWASSVIDFSSQYSPKNYDALEATGAPNTAYGDYGTAWAPWPKNGTLEYITLGFTTPVYATGTVIWETNGNGFVYRVDVLDVGNTLHMVWTGTDPSQPGTPVDFKVTFATLYLVQGVKIYTNTDHDLGTWEEIDAVKLTGSTSAPVPLPPSLFLLAPCLISLAAFRRRFRKS